MGVLSYKEAYPKSAIYANSYLEGEFLPKGFKNWIRWRTQQPGKIHKV